MIGPTSRKEEKANDPDAWGRVVRRIVRRFPLSFCGLAFILVVTVAAIIAPLISPYDPLAIDLAAMLRPPSAGHILGTDDLGRDVLSRLIYGGRASLAVALVSVSISLGAGLLIGLVAGYSRGSIDSILMRVMDAQLAFPGLVLGLAIAAVLGPKLINTMVAIGIVYIPQFARLVRGQVLVCRDLEYVQAARCVGASDKRILLLHILPNITTPLIVQVTLCLAYAILLEAALSFLGVGVQPPQPAWGSMLRTGYPYLETAPWLAFTSGGAIFLMVMAFNFLGDGIQALFARTVKR